MIVALPFLLAGAGSTAPSEADAIVIIAQRLEQIAVNVGRDPQGRYHCSLEGTTGLRKLDEQLCKTTTKCVRNGAADEGAIKACVQDSKPRLIERIRAYLRDQRATEKKT